MLKVVLKRIVGVGITPRLLMARVAILRVLGRISRPRIEPSKTVGQILFSFPYHSVGDLVLSLTLVDHIHDVWPEARIDVVVGSTMGALVSAIPYVHRVFQLPRSRIRQPLIAAYAELQNATRLFRDELSGIAYDLAIAPRWDSADSFFSAYLAYLTGAPIRCGYSGGSDGGSKEVDNFLTVAATGGGHEHESLRYARLLSRCGLESAGAIDPATPQSPIHALQCVAERRKTTGEAMRSPVCEKYVVFSPGATNPRRMWPIERFSEVGRVLFERRGLRTIIIGGPADGRLCAQLANLIGDSALSVAGKTDSLQMLDLLAGSELFLGNDSGPAHIAGGLGISTVVVSPFPLSCALDHPNSPQRFRPAGPRVKVLQPQDPLSPCSPMCQQDAQHCILQVSGEEVLAAIQSVLHEWHGARA
ncbi:MAG: glycosyltransferase family 9 protein [Silvibacterium sp.]